jgi:molybdopterin-guanine dinucleotide biosynthesis protein A
MQCSAGILAGGEGRRLGGADKGWIDIHGQPLIVHVLDSLRPGFQNLLISANRHLDRYAALGVPVLPDTLGAGPLAGVARLLQAAPDPWLLCVPCDAGALAPNWLARFAALAGDDIDAVVLDDGERVHPTFCLLRTSLASAAEARLQAGQYGLYPWLQTLRLARLHAALPANLNTPEQLADYRDAVGDARAAEALA